MNSKRSPFHDTHPPNVTNDHIRRYCKVYGEQQGATSIPAICFISATLRKAQPQCEAMSKCKSLLVFLLLAGKRYLKPTTRAANILGISFKTKTVAGQERERRKLDVKDQCQGIGLPP
ncbi:unnamed protein product [Phytophthora lilii]|uniref:Unnamed protein product n=1 Tax=Phytophthora lilii TaxID=2077276 RepID=A0A9W6U3V8_9STRA|nr:unnamed protein product [Phytophthora lilii]